MKAKSLTIALILFSTALFAQNHAIENLPFSQKHHIDNHIYQMFPTQNIWTFIKLDTRNGKLWQVHFSINGESERGELDINIIPLVDKEEESNGRFTLYPTKNMYNFLMLDHITGAIFQVQWSREEESRFIIPIF